MTFSTQVGMTVPSEHRPAAVLQADVFIEPADFENGWTYEDVARQAWEDICHWVEAGYLPVLTVLMPDGSQHEVDLEKVVGEENA